MLPIFKNHITSAKADPNSPEPNNNSSSNGCLKVFGIFTGSCVGIPILLFCLGAVFTAIGAIFAPHDKSSHTTIPAKPTPSTIAVQTKQPQDDVVEKKSTEEKAKVKKSPQTEKPKAENKRPQLPWDILERVAKETEVQAYDDIEGLLEVRITFLNRNLRSVWIHIITEPMTKGEGMSIADSVLRIYSSNVSLATNGRYSMPTSTNYGSLYEELGVALEVATSSNPESLYYGLGHRQGETFETIPWKQVQRGEAYMRSQY